MAVDTVSENTEGNDGNKKTTRTRKAAGAAGKKTGRKPNARRSNQAAAKGESQARAAESLVAGSAKNGAAERSDAPKSRGRARGRRPRGEAAEAASTSASGEAGAVMEPATGIPATSADQTTPLPSAVEPTLWEPSEIAALPPATNDFALPEPPPPSLPQRRGLEGLAPPLESVPPDRRPGPPSTASPSDSSFTVRTGSIPSRSMSGAPVSLDDDAPFGAGLGLDDERGTEPMGVKPAPGRSSQPVSRISPPAVPPSHRRGPSAPAAPAAAKSGPPAPAGATPSKISGPPSSSPAPPPRPRAVTEGPAGGRERREGHEARESREGRENREGREGHEGRRGRRRHRGRRSESEATPRSGEAPISPRSGEPPSGEPPIAPRSGERREPTAPRSGEPPIAPRSGGLPESPWGDELPETREDTNGFEGRIAELDFEGDDGLDPEAVTGRLAPAGGEAAPAEGGGRRRRRRGGRRRKRRSPDGLPEAAEESPAEEALDAEAPAADVRPEDDGGDEGFDDELPAAEVEDEASYRFTPERGGREMLINVTDGEECRVAVLQDGKLEELFIERDSSLSHVGNIYKGRVTNVEPSIQAVFVDFGLPRNGFLHISDVHTRYFPDGRSETEDVGRKIARRDRPPIQKCLRRGDEVVVQITKEGVGTKGPTLTTYLSIPGRYLVMMPGMSKMGVSRKIEDDESRRSMRTVLNELILPEGMGFILRTAGMGQSKRELQRDLNYLTRLWKTISERERTLPSPAELYRESDLVARTIRDVYTSDFRRVVVDEPATRRRVSEFVRIAMPRARSRVEQYNEREPLFHRFGLEEEIVRLNSRYVPLPSGGSIVIDSHEAMVTIDVNSGKFRKLDNAEDTALKIDLEAAEEIARQLRLRDLGGLIVCDFIDMRLMNNRRKVVTALKNALKKHKERVRVLNMSQFGLVEITRQRQRPSILRSIYVDCPHCTGRGMVKTPESMTLDVMRFVQYAAFQEQVREIRLMVSHEVAYEVLNRKRDALGRMESESGKRIVIQGTDACSGSTVLVQCLDERGGVADVHIPGDSGVWRRLDGDGRLLEAAESPGTRPGPNGRRRPART